MLVIYFTGMTQVFSFPPSTDSHSVLNGNHHSSNTNFKILSKTFQNSFSQSEKPSKQSASQSCNTAVLNGKNGTAEESIYENVGSCLSQNQGNKTPPVPPRMPNINHPPVPHPRTFLLNSGGQKAQDCPQLLRNTRAEATPSPTPYKGTGQSTHNVPQRVSCIKVYPSAPSSPRLQPLQKRSIPQSHAGAAAYQCWSPSAKA